MPLIIDEFLKTAELLHAHFFEAVLPFDVINQGQAVALFG
jgi:hypothetical protein